MCLNSYPGTISNMYQFKINYFFLPIFAFTSKHFHFYYTQGYPGRILQSLYLSSTGIIAEVINLHRITASSHFKNCESFVLFLNFCTNISHRICFATVNRYTLLPRWFHEQVFTQILLCIGSPQYKYFDKH